jgi:hypothetical protein
MIKLKDWLPSRFLWLWLGAAACLIFLYFHMADPKGDVPAWIQAGGSMLAIIASFWVVDLNRKSEQRERRSDIFAVVKAAHGYAQKIRKVVDVSHSSNRMIDSSIYNIYHRSITDGFSRALANIPFHEVGASEAVESILDMQVQFAKFLPDSVDALVAGPQKQQAFLDVQIQFSTTSEPEKSQQVEVVFVGVFNTLANNLRGNLDRIDADFDLIESHFS